MKKYLIMALALGLPACACFEGQEEDTRSETTKVYKTQNVRRVYEKPEPVYVIVDEEIEAQNIYTTGIRYRYEEPISRPVVQYAQPVQYVQAPVAAAPCQGSVTETREPVEVVYKKTVKTVSYEPKVSETVSFEKEAYNASNANLTISQPVSVQAQPIVVQSQPVSVQAQPVLVQTQPANIQTQPTIIQTQPAIEVYDSAVPANEITYKRPISNSRTTRRSRSSSTGETDVIIQSSSPTTSELYINTINQDEIK